MRVIDFKDAKCRHCYKCVRNCDVKAIAVQNEQARIIQERCIHCGHCLEVCPQNAKTFASDVERVKGYLKSNERTVISIAPSYMGVLDFDRPEQLVGALMSLGFYEVRETAEGAAMVTNEYKRLIREGEMENIITTCCPSVNDLVEKYYPECAKYLAPVVSPMIAHGRYIKKTHGADTRVVFLGPCIAKKQEAVGDERIFGAVDAILTFEEIDDWFNAAGINVRECEDKPFANPTPEVNRLYPIGGGVIQSVIADNDMEGYDKVQVDGLKNCMEMLECLKEGGLSKCFIEANVCAGGCVKGPASSKWNKSFVKARVKLERDASYKTPSEIEYLSTGELERAFGDRSLHEDLPSEKEYREILKAIGKYSEKDELNCGACGYSTCREKAAAVYNGKAEINMCLPYTLMQSESMSNVVLDVTPDAILIIDSEMRIIECNKKAQALLGVSKEEALERYIFEFMEADDVEKALSEKRSIQDVKIKLEHEGLIMRRNVAYIGNMDCALLTFHDITNEEKIKEQHYNFKLEAMDIAKKVIDKQMTVAQEIAGLLGETTAETKVTMTKLRDLILED